MFDVLWDALPAIGTVAAWVVTICLLVLGFVGTLVPFLPGHLILFFAAGAHWLMLRQESGVVEMEYAALYELRRR
jgi:uncharacterized protein YqgC (DUF456 family)